MKFSAILATSFLALAASALPAGGPGLPALNERSQPKETPKQIELGLATDKRSRPVESAKDIALGEATDKRSQPKETPKQIELGEATDKKRASGSDIVAQLQSTFDRNNPNGTPANGSEDDLNGDGVINAFEAGAQADKRDLVKDCDPRECATD
ncbi:hypothetical protein N0V93_005743 [Gnomoniopsis smithogilvyi]|uniref:Secreted protein n=1 Tax=Gnomoniopsis smithogilvyi TaxID=1191159 RepID=A0A9W9CYF4_9PEZI|nr:hypothetical protein N0V93_005743 [Gnomoniopsis smithogilvyi]